MPRQMTPSQSPVLTNPNRGWVLKELEKLYLEWVAWALVVEKIVDQPYNAQTQTEVFADGEDKMKAHEILQAKTLAFLDANIQGHGFIDGFDGHGCDRTDLRLKHRVKHRSQRLDILRASLQYAVTRVPEHNAPSLSLEALRGRLTSRQRALLNDVWSRMKATGLGSPERPLFDSYTREGLVAETKALGGSVIFTNHTENKLRYTLTMLGIFLTSDGPRVETLMRKYLEVLKSMYLDNRDIERISSKVLEAKKDPETDSPVFSTSELKELRLIVSLSLNSFASRSGGSTPEEWFIAVDDDVVALKRVSEWTGYIHAEIMKRYDAKEPVAEAERVFYSNAPNSNSLFDSTTLPRGQSKTSLSRLWESVSLRPGLFGIGVDLKKLFSRKKPPAGD